MLLPNFVNETSGVPDGSGLFQQDNALCQSAKTVQEWFVEHDEEFKVLSRSQSDWTSMGCTGPTNLIHGGPTSLFAHSEVLQSPCLDVSELFWQHEWDLHDIRQVVSMLWLISELEYRMMCLALLLLCAYRLYSTGNKKQGQKRHSFKRRWKNNSVPL